MGLELVLFRVIVGLDPILSKSWWAWILSFQDHDGLGSYPFKIMMGLDPILSGSWWA